jgi:hypothetical protein
MTRATDNRQEIRGNSIRPRRPRLALLAAAIASVLAAACSSLGPQTMDRDQISYGNSIGENWKHQMLANIVKVRYLDMPVFVDVGQIVAGYTLEAQLGAGFNIVPGYDNQSISGYGRFTDRPTVTYSPKTGDAYLRSLLTPVSPQALLSLIAAGYDPGLLFTWVVASVNGIPNFSGHRGEERAADPRFLEIVALLGDLREGRLAGFEVRESAETGHVTLLVFRRGGMTPEQELKRQRLSELLGLDPDKNEFRVVYAPVETGHDVLAIETRSIMQTVAVFARFIDVPADKAGWAEPPVPLLPGQERPFTVRTGPAAPANAFAAARYQDDWYWIDQTDRVSKRVFTMMLFLTTLTSDSGTSAPPLLTIPAN